MAAALAPIQELERIDGCARIKAYGTKLQTGLETQAAEIGLEIHVTGEPALLYMTFAADDDYERMDVWCTACIERGVFFHPRHNWFLTTSHTTLDLERTLEATRAAFAAVKERFGV